MSASVFNDFIISLNLQIPRSQISGCLVDSSEPCSLQHQLCFMTAIAIVCILCPLLLLVLASHSRSDESDTSLRDNLFGTCRLQEVLQYPAYSDDADVFNVYRTSARADVAEMATYRSLPQTLSQVNSKLAQGIVKGKPCAALWAARKDNSWQYPEQHPRRNKTNCLQLNNAAVQAPISVYAPFRELATDFYLIMKNHVLIHESGVIASQCGYFQLLEGCETTFKFIGRKWHQKCAKQLTTRKLLWDDVTSLRSPLLQPAANTNNSKLDPLCRDAGMETWQYVPKVLVVSSIWDHNYHHFLIDVLPRLIRYLPYLQANPDVKVHLRRSERGNKLAVAARAIAMKQRILSMLGITMDRIVSGPIIATEAMLPRAVMCNFPVLNALEVRMVMNTLLSAAGDKKGFYPLTNVHPVEERAAGHVIILQVRHCHVGMKCNNWRTWDTNTTTSMTMALRKHFPHSQVSHASLLLLIEMLTVACRSWLRMTAQCPQLIAWLVKSAHIVKQTCSLACMVQA